MICLPSFSVTEMHNFLVASLLKDTNNFRKVQKVNEVFQKQNKTFSYSLFKYSIFLHVAILILEKLGLYSGNQTPLYVLMCHTGKKG